MMRVKHITKKVEIDTDREKIANFLNMDYNDVRVHEAPNTYIVDISENEKAQSAYKARNPFGNGSRPNSFDFNQEILVRWDSDKLQAM